jgi:hypothetical protein
MPLPPPSTERKPSHIRRIVCEGFERADGLFDIDGWLTDTKGFVFPEPFRGDLAVGEPQHDLGLRITIDLDFMIKDVIAVMNATPTEHCLGAAPNFKKLIGLKLTPGFNRVARNVLDGTLGCTHLIDLLGPMATTAFQTIWAKNFQRAAAPAEPNTPPPIVNSCRGWADDGALVSLAFPKFYKGPPLPRADH